MTEDCLYWFHQPSPFRESCRGCDGQNDFANGQRTTGNGRFLPNNKGFSLVEVIVVVLLLAIAIVPMISAFAPAVRSIGIQEETLVFTNQVRGTLNRVAALDFPTLWNNRGNPADLVTLFGSPAEATKETFSFQGENYTPTVAITDESGGAGGLLEITVTLDYVSLKTLKADY